MNKSTRTQNDPNQNPFLEGQNLKIRTAEIASANERVKALPGLLRCAAVLRVTPPARQRGPAWLGGPGRAGRFPSGPQPIVVSWGF